MSFVSLVKGDRWETRAACKDWDGDLDDFFPVSEDSNKVHLKITQPPLGIYNLCVNRCPVQAECLGVALKDNHVGIWGGTTYSQRRIMLRSRVRAKCIRCLGTEMVRHSGAGICLSCGFSWRIPPMLPTTATNSPQLSTR